MLQFKKVEATFVLNYRESNALAVSSKGIYGYDVHGSESSSSAEDLEKRL